MKIGHLFLSIFEIKKKVLKIKKPSIFSISLKYLVKWRVMSHILCRFWPILADFGRFWPILADFGRFWPIFVKKMKNYQKIPEKCDSHKKI
jgi:hypothetical protein